MDEVLFATMTEKQRRLFLGMEAIELGHGGIALLSRMYHVSEKTVSKGVREVKDGVKYDPETGERRKGAGRKPLSFHYPNAEQEVIKIVENASYGSPVCDAKWVTMSVGKILELLHEKGIHISGGSVYNLLRKNHYSRQQNQKMLQNGTPDPDRDAQFRHIADKMEEFMESHDPIVSVDTKKKENIGNYKAEGSEWRKSGDPRPVLDHDFCTEKLIPFGIYDIERNSGVIICNQSHDTAEFACRSLEYWIENEMKPNYPGATRLLYLSDSGGSDSRRSRMFKKYMQELADRTGLELHVCHYPKGTSKWNPIEHKMFGPISINIQARPIESVEGFMHSVSRTTTESGLKVQCTYDSNHYETGQQIKQEEYNAIPVCYDDFCGKYNYSFFPRERKQKNVTGKFSSTVKETVSKVKKIIDNIRGK